MKESIRLNHQPIYKIGQIVIVELETVHEKTQLKFKNEVEGYIMRITASGTSEIDTYTYGITRDMPGCYHGGEPPFIEILENNIRLK